MDAAALVKAVRDTNTRHQLFDFLVLGCCGIGKCRALISLSFDAGDEDAIENALRKNSPVCFCFVDILLYTHIVHM